MQLKVFIPPNNWADLGSHAVFDIATVFCEPQFEFTENPNDADIIPINLVAQSMSLGQYLAPLRKVFERYGPDKMYVDVGHCFHIGEGHSALINVIDSSKLVQDVLDTIPEERRPRFMTIITNRFAWRDKDLHYVQHLIPSHIQYADYLWCRQVCFFNDQPDKIFKHPNRQRNHWWQPLDDDQEEMPKDIFELNSLDDACNWDIIRHYGEADGFFKLYLSPNRYRGPQFLKSHKTGYYKEKTRTDRQHKVTTPAIRDMVREDLGNYLENWPGFLGDTGKGTFLVGQGSTKHLSDHLSCKVSGFLPIHNAYYENSVVSIFTETIVTTLLDDPNVTTRFLQKVTGLTEKTFMPLIKGHFILPFGHQHLVTTLQQDYLFQFPSFIDYSYDSEPNDLIRYHLFKQEVARVLNTEPSQLFKEKVLNKHILERNRNLFMENNSYRRYNTSVADAIARFNDTDNKNVIFPKVREALGPGNF